MGWFTDAKNWLKRLWQGDTASAVVRYSYQTIAHGFDQIAAIPRVLHSAATHPPTQMVAKHVMRVAVEDLIPLVFVTYCNQLIQERGRGYLEDEKEAVWLSTYTAIQAGLYLLQGITWAFQVNRKTEMMVRMAMVTIEASPMLNGAKTSLPMKVCTDPPNPCTTLRFMQGSIRDLVAFWSTEAAISLTGYIPVAGGGIAALLSVYHNGRYVLTVVLPDLCNRHQMVYLQDHSELALSLGVGHVASTWLVNSLLEISTGIPRVFYAGAIKQFMLITQMGVAAHLNLPEGKKASTRTLPDPLLYYQSGVGFIVDIILLGLKTKIPRMLKGNDHKSLKAWLSHLSASEFSYLQWVNEKVPINQLARVIFPRLIHSKETFITDPVILSNWATVQASLVQTLQTIESLHDLLAVQASSFAPNAAASLAASIFGTPKFLTKLLLQLLSDPVVIEQLRSWRYQVEKFNLIVSTTPVRPDKNALLLPGQTSAHEQSLQFPPIERVSGPLPEAEQVIRTARKAPLILSLPSAHDVIRRRHVGLEPTENVVSPRNVIRFHAAQLNDPGVAHNPFADHQETFGDVPVARR